MNEQVYKTEMMLMKKPIALLLCFVFAVCISACAKSGSSEPVTEQNGETDAGLASMANPMTELTKEEFEALYGASTVLEDAEDVHYYKIEYDEINIAQLDFTVNGREYCFRFEKGDPYDISGMYYAWTYDSETDKDNTYKTVCHLQLNETEGVGLCSWYDTDNRRNYSLSVSANADPLELVTICDHFYGFYSAKYGEE